MPPPPHAPNENLRASPGLTRQAIRVAHLFQGERIGFRDIASAVLPQSGQGEPSRAVPRTGVQLDHSRRQSGIVGQKRLDVQPAQDDLLLPVAARIGRGW